VTGTEQSAEAGGASNGFSTLVDAAVAASQASVVEPAPDPRVSAAFALGWQIAELYRQDPPSERSPAAPDDLPGVGRLDDGERAAMAVRQVDAAIAKLRGAITTAGLPVPPVGDLEGWSASPTDRAERRRVVRALHFELLATLTATDFRIGKAYGAGRSLADICRNSVTTATLEAEFARHRIQKLEQTLDDLASAFPPHVGHSVRASVSRWVDALGPPPTVDPASAPRDGKPSWHPVTGVKERGRVLLSGQKPAVPPVAVVDHDKALGRIHRQGQLWRSLLSGEKCATDMLAINNYLNAADEMLTTNGVIAWRYVRRYWYVVALSAVLFMFGVVLLVATSSSGTIVAGLGSILASVGLTWKSAGSTLGGLGAKLEHDLWGAELDRAIADAITILPDGSRDYARRGNLTGTDDAATAGPGTETRAR
jgi:hypothetical protein